jgi:hypothetical protein
MDPGQPEDEADVGCVKTPPRAAHRTHELKERPRMAAMKPRTGDGPLEGGGRLVVELNATEAAELGEALTSVVS